MTMGKAYWAKSMVVARLTGVPYRQNDILINAVNGRVLIRSLSAHGLTIDTDSFVQLQCKEGRLLLRVMEDKRHLLKQHPRYVKGQANMVLYARQQARQACMMYGVKQLRAVVKGVVRVSDKEVVAELERVDDLAEMYDWGSRRVDK